MHAWRDRHMHVKRCSQGQCMRFGVELKYGAVSLLWCVWCGVTHDGTHVRSMCVVWCGAQEVMVVAGTKPMYNVDVYSGNHPFYQGHKTFMVMDEGQLNKFKKRFADLEELNVVPVLQAGRQIGCMYACAVVPCEGAAAQHAPPA